MVRQIIWSHKAQEDRKSIFTYLNNRNKSTIYSRKLNRIYIEAAELLAIHPKMGKKTHRIAIRVKFVRDYMMIYQYTDKELLILTIFDSRQNLEKLLDL